MTRQLRTGMPRTSPTVTEATSETLVASPVLTSRRKNASPGAPGVVAVVRGLDEPADEAGGAERGRQWGMCDGGHVTTLAHAGFHRVGGSPHLRPLSSAEPRRPGRSEGGSEPSLLDRSRKRRDVVGAAMAAAVDEERRRAGDAAEIGAVDVLRDPRRAGLIRGVRPRTDRARARAAPRSRPGPSATAHPDARAAGRASPRTRPDRRRPRSPRRRVARGDGRR